MKKLKEFGAIERLTRSEMRNVKGGVRQPGGPGECASACGDGLKACPENSPYCLTTNCRDNQGVTHEIKGCSPTLPQ